MRGKADDVIEDVYRHGITPAYAGKSLTISLESQHS